MFHMHTMYKYSNIQKLIVAFNKLLCKFLSWNELLNYPTTKTELAPLEK